MPTQAEWQAKVERRVAGITQGTSDPQPVRHEPLHISGWTVRDQLLSDALHAFDVAQGLDRSLVTSVEFETDSDPKFRAHYKAERGWESHGAHERAIETWQRRNEPVLTSDANKTHDPSPAARRWVNGHACMEAIELEHAADVEVTVEPLREELAQIDALIEDNRDAWVEDLLDERREIERNLLAAVEGEKAPTLPEHGRRGKRACPNSFVKRSGGAHVDEDFTVPTAKRLRDYAVTFLTGRYGVQSERFGTECSPLADFDRWANTGWRRAALQEAMADHVELKAALDRRARGLDCKVVWRRDDGRAIRRTFRPRADVVEVTPARSREEDRRLLLKAARRDLMPLSRPVVWGFQLPAFDDAKPKESAANRQECRAAALIDDVTATRLYATLRLADYRSGRYQPIHRKSRLLRSAR